MTVHVDRRSRSLTSIQQSGGGNVVMVEPRLVSNPLSLAVLTELLLGPLHPRLVEHTPADAIQALGSVWIMPPVPHWHRGRMVLVGDAVYAPSPCSG